jgi:dipeptidase E
LLIPTAMQPFSVGPAAIYRLITGQSANPLVGLGWKSLGVFELTALPSIEKETWVATVQATDALLVWGGDPFYLSRWMLESGLAELLPSLSNLVYVGVSAGSMATAPVFGETYGDPDRPFVIGTGAALVDFALLPHMDHADHPESTSTKVEAMARNVPVPTYGIDDQTAIKVRHETIEVVSEGRWRLFNG